MTIVSVPCVLTPRLTIGTTSPPSAAHSSNLQLTRVELSTREATRGIDKSRNEKLVNTALPQSGFGAEGARKSQDEDRGREEPKERHLDKATKHLQRRTTIGRAKDAQAQNQFSRSVK